MGTIFPDKVKFHHCRIESIWKTSCSTQKSFYQSFIKENVLSNLNNCYPMQNRLILLKNMLSNLQNVLSNAKRFIQRENVLSNEKRGEKGLINFKMCYPTQNWLDDILFALYSTFFSWFDNTLIALDNTLSCWMCQVTHFCVGLIQSINVLSNANNIYPTEKLVIQREYVLSNARNVLPIIKHNKRDIQQEKLAEKSCHCGKNDLAD